MRRASSGGCCSDTSLNVRWGNTAGCGEGVESPARDLGVEGGKPPARKIKRPERPASVPYRSFKVLRPGRGADPRYPLGPPLMLSPVALPGNVDLDGISDPFPLADPSGQTEIYGVPTCRAINLSTKSRPGP